MPRPLNHIVELCRERTAQPSQAPSAPLSSQTLEVAVLKLDEECQDLLAVIEWYAHARPVKLSSDDEIDSYRRLARHTLNGARHEAVTLAAA